MREVIVEGEMLPDRAHRYGGYRAYARVGEAMEGVRRFSLRCRGAPHRGDEHESGLFYEDDVSTQHKCQRR